MSRDVSPLSGWTPEQIAQGKRWVETWRRAGKALEGIRQKELRELDIYRTIELLCGDYDYRSAPRAPGPSSGLVQQQRLFKKAANRE